MAPMAPPRPPSPGLAPAWVIGWLAALELFLVLADGITIERPWGMSVWIWGPLDSVAHATVAALVVLPGTTRHRDAPLALMTIAALTAAMLDADHFIAVGSLSLHAATSMPLRPATHSFVFGAACGVLVGLVTRRRALGLTVGLALISHVLRDAPTGAPLFAPVPGPLFVPGWLYRAGTPLLGLIAWWGFGPAPAWLIAADARLRAGLRRPPGAPEVRS